MQYIPNILTVIRLILIPIFIGFFFSDIPMRKNISLLVFLIANLTDFLDGYLARKYNLITDTGKVLDPLADKLLLIAVLFCLYQNSIIPGLFFYLVLFSESFMISYGTFLYFKNEQIIIPSNIFGKLATAIFFITIVILLVAPENPLILPLVIASILFKLIAFINYGFQYYTKHFNVNN